MDLLSFLGVLVVCTLIVIVGIVLLMAVSAVIYAIVDGIKKGISGDNDDGSDT
jgi:hypothetical protein